MNTTEQGIVKKGGRGEKRARRVKSKQRGQVTKMAGFYRKGSAAPHLEKFRVGAGYAIHTL